jgi:hypothetical protein
MPTQPSPASSSTDEAKRGLVIAVRRSGDWPVAGSLEEFQSALRVAGHEVDFVYQLGHRYSRRFRRAPPERLLVRQALSTSLFQRRAGIVHLLRDRTDGRA